MRPGAQGVEGAPADAGLWSPRAWSRTDAAVAGLLWVQSFVLLWPNRSVFLNVWDSTLFSYAVHEYDLLRGHPHPPGYPVFVFLTRMAATFVGDAHASVLLVSASLGAASVALLYCLVRQMASRMAAVVGASLYALTPNLVYNGSLALSYTAEAAASVGVALLAWRVHAQGSRQGLLALGGVFALAVGTRPSVGFYLFPLVVWAVRLAGGQDALRRAATVVAASGVTGLLWFLPMLWFGGGWDVWIATTRLQSEAVVFSYTAFNAGWPAILDHGGRFWYYLHSERALAWIGIPALASLAILGRGPFARIAPSDSRIVFFLLWTLPSLLFFALVFSGWDKGPRGYALVFVPALYAAYALIADCLAARATTTRPGRLGTVAGSLALSAILLAPGVLLVQDSRDLVQDEIRDHDDWARAWLALRDEFPANETGLLASHSWAFAQWYFPDYVLWGCLPDTPKPGFTPDRILIETRHRRDDVPLFAVWLGEAEPPRHPVPAHVRRVVVMDFQLAGENNEPRLLEPRIEVKEHLLRNGWRILYFDVPPEHPFVESWFGFARP